MRMHERASWESCNVYNRDLKMKNYNTVILSGRWMYLSKADR
jgi:hypothetical protein